MKRGLREFYNHRKTKGEKHVSEDVRLYFCEFFLFGPTLLYHIINRVESAICKYVNSMFRLY